MPRRNILLFVGSMAAVSIGVAAWLMWPPQLELSRQRFFAVQAAIQDASDPVIVFGDSIVEGAPLPARVCGIALVNAGVRGAGVGYFLRHADQLLGSSHPRLIVLAVGINNAALKEHKEVDFRSHYEQTVASLAGRAPVAVATVTPIQKGYFVSSFGYSPQIVPALNRAIRATPSVVAVIDLNGPLAETNFTIDGVHLGAAGYKVWTGAMVKGIEAALGCNPLVSAAFH